MAKSSRKKQTKKVKEKTTTASATATPESTASATPKKATTKKGRRPQKKTNYTPWIIGGLVIVGLILFPQIQRQYKLRTATGEFAQLIREGNSQVGKLQERHRDLGRTHVPFGTDISYNSVPPTTGAHYGSWINPGYYIDEQEPKQLVHSLEHGHIVAYYGEGTEESAKEIMIDWTNDFRNQWAGFVLTPLEQAGDGVILTAWRHTLRLDTFDPAIAAAFIDRHRGRGPENPVR